MTASDIPLTIQTAYAELIDQLRLQMVSAFPAGSTFRLRKIGGQNYWYAQPPTTPAGRPAERYLGVDTLSLRVAVESAKQTHDDAKARRQIVRALIAGGLPRPDPITGAVLEALAQAGAFRLRAVVVGSGAYAVYAGLLGIKLPAASVRTGDVDIAQDFGVSVAIGEALDRPLLDVLRDVDPAFTPRAYAFDPALAASFVRPGGFRVDVLTTSRGRVRDVPSRLPALRADATPLPFLDFALRETVEAAVLHRGGVLVRVPAAPRFAVHKLLVSARRGKNSPKARKDLMQAQSLISALVSRDADELRDVFAEARARGPSWREHLDAALSRLDREAASSLAVRRRKT
jgi:hypothetical protein